jgi:glucose/arabinose dehydrogenase
MDGLRVSLTPSSQGFVPDSAGPDVYGRPVRVAILRDGSLLVSDDGVRIIWRIPYRS